MCSRATVLPAGSWVPFEGSSARRSSAHQLQVVQAHGRQTLDDLLGHEHPDPLEIPLPWQFYQERAAGGTCFVFGRRPARRAGIEVPRQHPRGGRGNSMRGRFPEQGRGHQQDNRPPAPGCADASPPRIPNIARSAAPSECRDVDVGLADQVNSRFAGLPESVEEDFSSGGMYKSFGRSGWPYMLH